MLVSEGLSRRGARTKRKRPAGESSSPRGRAERTLSRESVIAAALAEIDRTGLENFSLRGLAKTLGVFPTAVNWHISSRSQLLAEVARVVLEDVPPPGFHDSWQGYLRQFMIRFREAIRRHPNVAPLIGTQLVANPAVDWELVERLLAVLSHIPLSGVKLVAGYNCVIAAVVGFTTQEFAPVPADDTRSWQKEIRDRLANVPSFKYPLLAQNVKLLSNRAFTLRWQNGTEAPLDASFEAFIDIQVSGRERGAAQE
jgi:TetR/AcrR family transcriptional regulator, tetracycline repressor protein